MQDAYPVHWIEEIQGGLCQAKYFLSQGFLRGYNQISVKEADRPKTAFVAVRALFMCNPMPIALSNEMSTFPRLMDSLFEIQIVTELLVYLKGIVHFPETLDKLLAALERPIQIIIKTGLKSNARNCQLFRPFIEYLGYLITGGRIAPDPKNIEKARQTRPLIGIDIPCFQWLWIYYWKLISHFAEISRLMWDFPSQTNLDPTPELLIALNAMKNAMYNSKSIAYPRSGLIHCPRNRRQ